MPSDAQQAAATAATTEAVTAAASSRGADDSAEQGCDRPRPGLGVDYDIGAAIRRLPVAPYERQKDDPLYRRLRVYTVDPSLPRLEGAVATVNVPFEPLEPGPAGALFETECGDGQRAFRAADLDSREALIADGYPPSPSDPRFHQQMVYAVCSNVHASFATALGRNPAWGFGSAAAPQRLRLRPHAGESQNAWYDRDQGELRFGYFAAPEQPVANRTLPGGWVFACLSHDIVAHEVTHALLDGMREHYALPTGGDAIAFHEAFADIVAVFQHFSYREVVLAALRRSRVDLESADLLTQLALQFGHTTGRGGALRTAIEPDSGAPLQYAPDMEPHALGSVLVSAVFDAFVRVFKRKSERYLRLATGGTGVLPPGEMAHDLEVLLAERASKLAGQFLTICIRAIDYCPPVGLTFGDYLRALITADVDVVPDDRWDYRGALIDAFRKRNIYPRSAASLSEDALVWRGPRQPLPVLHDLAFKWLRFRGDPGRVAGPDELHRQACALGWFATRPAHMDEFGLVRDGDPRLGGDRVGRPCVASVRSARRAGPSGQIVFDLIAEITQQRHVAASSQGPAFGYLGGATVIVGPSGDIRYVVVKAVANDDRLERRRSFLGSREGRAHWALQDGTLVPKRGFFERLHAA